MANPTQDPRRPETATATAERPKSEAEAKEAERKLSIPELEDRAEKLKSDPNFKAAEAISELKGSLEPVQQLDGIAALNQALMSILVKLRKAGVDVSDIGDTANLEKKVNDAKKQGKIKLDTPEEVAMQNVNRVIKEGGPTAKEVRDNWGELKENSEEASKGWGSKAFDTWKEHPVAISALLIGGAFTAYFTAEAMATYVKKTLPFTAKKDDKRNKWLRGGILAPGGIALACGIIAAGAFLGEKRLKRILAMIGLSSDDVKDMKEKVEKGEEFTEEQKDKLEKGKDRVAEAVEEESKKRRGGSEVASEDMADRTEENEETDSGTTEHHVEASNQRISANEIERVEHYNVVTEALINLYCLTDVEKFRDIKGRMPDLFILINKVPVSKIVDAYDKAKERGNEKISFEELGVADPSGNEADRTALFHICAIVSVAFKEANELPSASKPDASKDVETFLNRLGNDPALDISNKVQSTIAEKMRTLDITSADSIKKHASELFDEKAINEIFDKEKDRFIEHLAKRYGIEMADFNPQDRLEFLRIIGLLYVKDSKLNQPEAVIDASAEFQSLKNPKVKEATKKFVRTLTEDTARLLAQCKARYDIKRENNKKYDRVLEKHLMIDKLHFRDGFQMAILTDGIAFDHETKYESVGQAKDIAMLYLMARILKDRDPDAYALYMSNLVELGSTTNINLDLNPYLKMAAPYFKRLFDMAIKKAGVEFNRFREFFEGLENVNASHDTVEKVAQMDWWSFPIDYAKTGVRGAYDLPMELIYVLMGEFPGEINANTNGEEILKFILAAGGSFSFPVESQLAGMVYLGGKYYFIKPFEITWDTTKALIEKDAGVAAKTYLIGTAPFVVIGAGSGVIRSLRVHHAIKWQSILGGAARGLGAPVSMPHAGYRHLRTINRSQRYLINVAREKTAENLQTSADLFIRYSNRVKKVSGTLQKAEGWLREPRLQASKLLLNDINNSMRIHWANYFTINYNSFWGLNPNLSMSSSVGETLQPIVVTDKQKFDYEKLLPRAQRMREIIRNLRKIENIDQLNEVEFLDAVKKAGLERAEINTLKARIEREGFAKFIKSFKNELAFGKGSGQKVSWARIREHFRKKPAPEGQKAASEGATETTKPTTEASAKETAPEAVKGSTETERALSEAEKDLAKVRKQIASAESDMKAVEAMRKRSALKNVKAAQERVDQARKIIEDGKQAEKELEATIKAFRSLQQTEAALDAAKAAKDATKVASLEREVRAAASVAQDALEASGKTVANIGKLGRWGTAFKWGGRALGGVGVGFSAFSAISSGYESITTDVEGRGTIKGVEAGLWTANAIADGAALAVMFGAEGAAVTYASAAAVPLVPLTYAGTTVTETLYEETKTDAEWLKEKATNPYSILHHFYTSMNSVSLGDAWVTVGSESLTERRDKAKTETMHRIYRGMIAFQKDPALLAEIQQGKLTLEQVDARIEKNYSKYHEFYFQYVRPVGLQSYGTAQQFALEAQMFDDIMEKRDEARTRQQPFIVMGDDKQPFSLHLDRYNINEDGTLSEGQRSFNPSHVVQSYKETMIRIFERDVIRKGNLDRMDSAYLIRLYVQIGRMLGDSSPFKAAIDREEGLRDALFRQAVGLSSYLKCARNINMTFAAGHEEYKKPPMSLEDIKKQLDGIDSVDNQAYLNFEKENYRMTPAMNAVYRLAEYFGYDGRPDEAQLKAFFHEGAASFHGLYWDGEEWVLQERGWESDDELGSELSEKMVLEVIKTMRDQPDNILEHRSDTVFMDAYDYSSEVTRMADILEAGLKEGQTRHYKASWT